MQRPLSSAVARHFLSQYPGGQKSHLPISGQFVAVCLSNSDLLKLLDRMAVASGIRRDLTRFGVTATRAFVAES